jgi:hypothetical protein
MNETGTLNIILNLLTLIAVGAVGALVHRVFRDVEELKALYRRVDRMEVKVDSLWAERTDSGFGNKR